MKTITILGSTGSIGTQALDVAKCGGYRVLALAAGKNTALLARQAREFQVSYVCTSDEQGYSSLQEELNDTNITVLFGQAGIETLAALQENDIVLNAIVGFAGLRGTVAAVTAGKPLALANKESLVCAGSIVMPLAKETGSVILPVDSEHSAIFQALRSGEHGEVAKLILTASGGPFFGKTPAELQQVTAKDALKHPSWSMGNKITIDSATLMNKGFELIEAMWLFGVPPEDIEVVVHRESIIHSAVEFVDGNVIAQLSMPDMRLPIAYALTHPGRLPLPHKPLRLWEVGKLSFYQPDMESFPCLPLCIAAARRGGNCGAIINGANEVAVAAFLKGDIGFTEIYQCVHSAYQQVGFLAKPSLEQVFESDAQARKAAEQYILNQNDRLHIGEEVNQ